MQEYEQDIIVQIVAFLGGKASKDEVLSLQAWVAQSEQNKAHFAEIKNIYEMSNRQLDSSTIRGDIALQNTIRRISPQKKTLRIGVWLQRVAAVLFIPLLATSLYFYTQGRENTGLPPVSYCEMQTAVGVHSSITLPDGTCVWLNSGSKICYPDRFTGDERTIYMEGEAYFEVTSSEQYPFVVNTPTIQVRATGTKFQVADFANSPVKEVSLLSGKVAVAKMDANENTTRLLDLKPGQRLEYDIPEQSTRLTEGDLYKYYAWKDNKIVFRNDPMTDVVKRISQLFGTEIELRGEELKTYRYRATFEEESLHEILRLLELTAPIKYQEVKRKIQKDGTFTPQKIVIYSAK